MVVGTYKHAEYVECPVYGDEVMLIRLRCHSALREFGVQEFAPRAYTAICELLVRRVLSNFSFGS